MRQRAPRLHELRRRCDRMLSELDLPSPFDPAVFCARLSDVRGRRIHLEPTRAAIGPCGAWLATDRADYIFYEEATSPAHQDHIIRHELGHLLSAHEPTSPLDEALARALAPDLDPAVVRRFRGRTTYSTEEEWEAEALAWLILERSGRVADRTNCAADNPGMAELLHGLEATLEQPGRVHRV